MEEEEKIVEMGGEEKKKEGGGEGKRERMGEEGRVGRKKFWERKMGVQVRDGSVGSMITNFGRLGHDHEGWYQSDTSSLTCFSHFSTTKTNKTKLSISTNEYAVFLSSPFPSLDLLVTEGYDPSQ